MIISLLSPASSINALSRRLLQQQLTPINAGLTGVGNLNLNSGLPQLGAPNFGQIGSTGLNQPNFGQQIPLGQSGPAALTGGLPAFGQSGNVQMPVFQQLGAIQIQQPNLQPGTVGNSAVPNFNLNQPTMGQLGAITGASLPTANTNNPVQQPNFGQAPAPSGINQPTQPQFQNVFNIAALPSASTGMGIGPINANNPINNPTNINTLNTAALQPNAGAGIPQNPLNGLTGAATNPLGNIGVINLFPSNNGPMNNNAPAAATNPVNNGFNNI